VFQVDNSIGSLLHEKKKQLAVMSKTTLDPRRRVEINLNETQEAFSLTFWCALSKQEIETLS
jgi:hypothetical protein